MRFFITRLSLSSGSQSEGELCRSSVRVVEQTFQPFSGVGWLAIQRCDHCVPDSIGPCADRGGVLALLARADPYTTATASGHG